MRSESTSALGQPSETNPTFGGAAIGARWRAASGLRPGLALVLLGGRRAERRECEAGEHVPRLALQLLLHLREHGLRLLDVRGHQALHRGPLKRQELRPELLVDLR